MSDQNQVDLAALDRLADLYKDGLITREEFERAKTALFPTASSPKQPELLPEPAPVAQPEPAPTPQPAPPPEPTPAPKAQEEVKTPGFQLPISAPPPPKAPPVAEPAAPKIKRIDVSGPVTPEPEIRIPQGPNLRSTPPSPVKSSKRGLYTAIAIVAILGFFLLIYILVKGVGDAGKTKPDEEWKPSPATSSSTPKIDMDAFKMAPGNPLFDVQFDEKIAQLEKERKKFDNRLTEVKFSNSLNATLISTKSGRQQSLKSIGLAQKYADEFHDSFLSTFTHIATWYTEQTGKELLDQEELRKVISEVRQEYHKFFDLYRTTVGYIESYRPTFNKKNRTFYFRTSRQVKNYNSNLEAIDKQVLKIDKVEKSLMERVKKA